MNIESADRRILMAIGGDKVTLKEICNRLGAPCAAVTWRVVDLREREFIEFDKGKFSLPLSVQRQLIH